MLLKIWRSNKSYTLPVRGPVGKTTLESNMTVLEKSKMHIAHILAVLLLELSPKDSCAEGDEYKNVYHSTVCYSYSEKNKKYNH